MCIYINIEYWPDIPFKVIELGSPNELLYSYIQGFLSVIQNN